MLGELSVGASCCIGHLRKGRVDALCGWHKRRGVLARRQEGQSEGGWRGNVTGRARAGKAHGGEAGHLFIVKGIRRRTSDGRSHNEITISLLPATFSLSRSVPQSIPLHTPTYSFFLPSPSHAFFLSNPAHTASPRLGTLSLHAIASLSLSSSTATSP